MEFNKTRSTLTETLEVVQGGYKVVSNIAIESGAIKSLSGYVKPEAEADEPLGVRTTSWSASKQNGEWGVRLDWITLENQDAISDIVTAVVTAIVADYEA